MNKNTLSESDIRTKFITPHLIAAGWDIHNQVREEVSFTDGRIHVRGESPCAWDLEARRLHSLLLIEWWDKHQENEVGWRI